MINHTRNIDFALLKLTLSNKTKTGTSYCINDGFTTDCNFSICNQSHTDQ